MNGGRCWGTMRARDLFLKILEQVRRCRAASVLGYVVMPEQVHLLLSEPRKGTLAKLMQVLKQRVSHAMRRRTDAPGQRATIAGVSSFVRWAARILAAEILRLQCLQRAEDPGEAGLHPQQPGEEEVGDAPQGLAVEQLGVLRTGRAGSGHDRTYGRRTGREESPPFAKTAKGRAPSSPRPR
jgi:Transposase IS200 like